MYYILFILFICNLIKLFLYKRIIFNLKKKLKYDTPIIKHYFDATNNKKIQIHLHLIFDLYPRR